MWKKYLLLSCLFLGALPVPILHSEAPLKVESMMEAEMLDELILNSEKQAQIISELKTNNLQLQGQLTIASESLKTTNHYLTMQNDLLNETRTLHENYADAVRQTLSTTRIELYFWRVAAGLFAGATFYLALR